MRPHRFEATPGLAACLVAFCLAFTIVAGCKPAPTTVVGKVTLDGKTLAVPANGRGTVVFQPDGGKGSLATGLLDATGNYKLGTGSSIEVPPGKYYVTVSVARLLAKTDNEEQGTELVTPLKYSSANDSGLEAKVNQGENKLDFDLKSDNAEQDAKAVEKPAQPSPPGPSPSSDSAPKNK